MAILLFIITSFFLVFNDFTSFSNSSKLIFKTFSAHSFSDLFVYLKEIKFRINVPTPICIKQAARSRKSYRDRENWLQWKHKICRYIIDILKPEYFNAASVSASDWAIKAYVDTEKWDFVLQFNGIDAEVRVNLKPTKGYPKSLLRDFWEQAQNKVNEWCECPFAKPHTSISTFFGRFCKELQPFFIEFEKGGYKARFTSIIYPDVLRTKKVSDFVFWRSSENKRQHYKCKFDENGKFLGWHKC